MPTAKSRTSLNSSTAETNSFRWQICTQCSNYFGSIVDHQCSDEIDGIFLGRQRARLVVHEHKTEYFKDLSLPTFMNTDLVFLSPESMRLIDSRRRNDEILIVSKSKDGKQFLKVCLVWPNSSIADNQVSLSRSVLEKLVNPQMVEIRTIAIDSIETVDSVRLKPIVSLSSLSSTERRLISICLNHQLGDRAFVEKGIIDFVFLGKTRSFSVEEKRAADDLIENVKNLSIEENEMKLFRIGKNSTSIEIEFEEKVEEIRSNLTFSEIGGLEKEKSVLRDSLSFHSNDLSTRGILLYGPKGCGKTMLINALSNEIGAQIVRINPAEIFSRNFGESETKLRQIFARLNSKSNGSRKSLLVVKNIEILCPNQEKPSQQFERRLAAAFIDLLDRNLDGKRIFFLATTNRIDFLDPDLRRSGRIDEEIEIGIPNQNDRLKIFGLKLSRIVHEIDDKQLRNIAERTHGFSGSDLENLCRKANFFSQKRNPESTKLQFEDFEKALCVVRASTMREVLLEVPTVRWSDIGGQNDLKNRLEEMVVWPLRHSDALNRLNVQVPKGILMYGPPGCSKTMVAKAIATESGLNFIAVKGPELFNKWVGESERAIRELFRRARLASPAIIFFDEIDAIASARSSSNSQSNVNDRVLATLLTEMDGIEKLKGVTIIGATNRPDCIDPALMRPGRFDRLVYVPLPDDKTREEIFRIRFQRSPIDPTIKIQDLVEKTKNYSGAEITAVCDEAALIALRQNIDAKLIELDHFLQALALIKPRTSDEQIRRLDDFTKRNGK